MRASSAVFADVRFMVSSIACYPGPLSASLKFLGQSSKDHFRIARQAHTLLAFFRAHPPSPGLFYDHGFGWPFTQSPFLMVATVADIVTLYPAPGGGAVLREARVCYHSMLVPLCFYAMLAVSYGKYRARKLRVHSRMYAAFREA